jgi:hypothetical protein
MSAGQTTGRDLIGGGTTAWGRTAWGRTGGDLIGGGTR